jgi:diacylglycerol O-acyltransferase
VTGYAEVLTKLGEWVGHGLMTLGVRLTARLHPFNLIVTNVPGPQMPLYLLGARLISGHPQVPLFESQSLGIALLSYAGTLCWGFNADWDQLPDLHEFVDAVVASFRELLDVARTEAHQRPARRVRAQATARP